MQTIYQPAGKALEYSPLALNLYSGCDHGCLYCYAPAATHKSPAEFRACPVPRKDILRELEAECKRKAGDMFEVKERVLLCFTTDPYNRQEPKLRITREAIRILKHAGYPVAILSKGGLRACADLELLDPAVDQFATTLTFLDERAEVWEPGAASPAERVEALRLARQRGLYTWVSLEPVLDEEQTMQAIELLAGEVNLIKLGKLNHAKPPTPINWGEFGRRAERRMQELGVEYYLKADLVKEMQR